MTTRSTVGRPRVARALAVIFTLFAALLLGTQAPVAANAAGTGTITGKVTLESGVPSDWIKGVSVSAESVSGSSYGSAFPQSDGTFAITGLDAGTYRVRFSTYSYWDEKTQKTVQTNLVNEYYGDTPDYSAATLVTVTAGGTASKTNVTLGKGGLITGKVTLPAGAPAEWRQAVSVSVNAIQGGSYGSAMLAQDGTYSVSGLAAGDYRVQFSSNTYYPPSGSPIRPNLIPEYYDDATSYDAAKPVAVTKGGTTSGIDATLAQGATISGKVTLPKNVPAGWVTSVSVNASPAVGNGPGAYGYVEKDGTYVLTGVVAGTYKISFTPSSTWWNPDTQQSEPTNLVPEYYDDALDWSSAKTVTVSAGDVKTGIDAALAKGATITGKITLPAGAPAEWLEGVSVSASQEGMGGRGYARDIAADGTYTLSGLSGGTYRVQFNVGVYTDANGKNVTPNLLSEYWNSTRDYNTATKITVAAGSTTSKIDASLDAGSSISGKITLPSGAPAQWVRAVNLVVRTASGEYAEYSSSIADDGTYAVFGLEPGDYKIQFSVGSIPGPSGGVYITPNLVSEFYDDAADFASARVLTLTAGQVRTKTDVTLAAGAELKGTLSGATPQDSYLELVDATKLDSADYIGTPVASDSSFAFAGLRPGTYWLRLYTWNNTDGSHYQFLKNPSGGYAFTIAGSGLSGQKLTAQPTTASIAGSLTATGFANQTADPNTKHYLADTRIYQKLDSTWVPLDQLFFFVPGAVSAEKNGTVPYTVPGLTAGTYTVGFEKSQTPYSANPAVTEQWWQKKTSLASADALTLTTGQKKTGIDGTVTGSTTPVTGFIDITGSAFTKEITWMYDQGISTGYETPNGREYRPFGKVTRDAMAAFLYRAAGSPQFDAPKTSPFTDVPTTHPFFKEIAWMDREKISTGWAVGNAKEYRPTLNTTRDAMAAFLYRYAKATDPKPETSPFTDVPADSAFLKEIAWMSSKGLSTGYDNGNGTRSFKPFDDITRDAMAAFLYRYKNQ